MAFPPPLPRPRELIQHWSREAGHRPAVLTAGVGVTYGELGSRVAAAAAILRAAGVDSGTLVGLAFANGVEYIVWLFGIFESGGTAMPLDPRLSAAETATLLDSRGVRFLAAAASLDPAKTSGWRAVDSALECGASLWRRPLEVNEHSSNDAARYLLHEFTSGSTGRSKQIRRTEDQIFEDYRHFSVALDLNANDRYLAVTPFFHAFGALGMFAALANGAALAPLARFMPATVLSSAKWFKPTLFMTTPPMVEMLGKCHLGAGDHDAMASLRHCICSTARLGREAYDAFRERFGIRVRAQYGSTETLSATVALDDAFEEGRVGRPYPGVEVRIFDDRELALAPDTVGRVGIRSPAACSGYADAEHELDQIEGFVLPGDKGYLDDTGCLYLVGRDDVYNIGGYKVDRHEVEAVIRAALPVRYVAVVPFQRAGQPALRAVIEADPGTVTANQVIGICRAQLSAYKVPAKVEIHDSLPRDANGKVRTVDLINLLPRNAQR